MSWLSKNKTRSSKEKQLECIVAQNFLENPWDWRKNSEILGLSLTFPQWFWQFLVAPHGRFPWSRVWIHIFSSKVDIHFIGSIEPRPSIQLTGNEGNDCLHQMLLDSTLYTKDIPFENPKPIYTNMLKIWRRRHHFFFPGGPVVWDTSRFIFRFSSVFYAKISSS